jgi:hypothetical protein
MPFLANRDAPRTRTILGLGVTIVGSVASAMVILDELRRPGTSLLHLSFHARHIVWVELGVFVIMAHELWRHAQTLYHGEDAPDDD